MKRLLPWLTSAVLLGWLLWRISPEQVARALFQLNWPVLVPLSALLVAGLYAWDAVCLWWLFDEPSGRVTYRSMLRARGSSYVLHAFNYALGQGALAVSVAQLQDRKLGPVVQRCAMLTYVDACVLLAMGLVGAVLSSDPRTDSLTVFCAVGLALLAGAKLLAGLLPAGSLEGLGSRCAAWFERGDWSWRQLGQLSALRLVYFMIGLLYVILALKACQLRFDNTVTLSVMPIVALVDGLPISVSGLGTRETTMVALLDPEHPALLLAFCLVWSVSMLLGRAAIGLGNLWLPRWFGRNSRAPWFPRC